MCNKLEWLFLQRQQTASKQASAPSLKTNTHTQDCHEDVKELGPLCTAVLITTQRGTQRINYQPQAIHTCSKEMRIYIHTSSQGTFLTTKKVALLTDEWINRIWHTKEYQVIKMN